MQHQSNNFRPQFSDEECITVYLWGISQRRFEQKTIYEYTKNHLSEWFPPTAQLSGFSDRLNQLAPAFQALAEYWLSVIGTDLQGQMKYIIDSCPIILAKDPRFGHARVAQELREKSYNSSRKEWYYDIKLHAVVARRPGSLPVPVSLMASGAVQHDLPAAKQITENRAALRPRKLYADKAYIDANWAQSLTKNHALELLTPRKKQKGGS